MLRIPHFEVEAGKYYIDYSFPKYITNKQSESHWIAFKFSFAGHFWLCMLKRAPFPISGVLQVGLDIQQSSIRTVDIHLHFDYFLIPTTIKS
jgi:hypothetical protein